MNESKLINNILFNNAILRFGDAFFYIGILWTLFNSGIENALLYVGIIGFLEASVNFLNIPFSTLIEKSEKRKLFIFTSIFRILTVIATIMCFATNIPFFFIAFLYFLHEITSAIISATNQVYTPQILSPDGFKQFQLKSTATYQIASVIALLFAGTAYTFINLSGMLFIELVSVTIFLGIILKNYVNLSPFEKHLNTPHFTMLKEGFLYISSKKKIVYIILLGTVLNGLMAPILQVVIPHSMFIQSPANASILTSIINIFILLGMSIMSYILLKNTKLLDNRNKFMSLGILTLIPFLFILMQKQWILSAIFALFLGFGTTLVNNAVNFIFIDNTEPEYLGRVGAVLSTFIQGGVALSIPLSALFIELTDYKIYISCVIFILIAIALILSFKKLFHSEIASTNLSNMN